MNRNSYTPRGRDEGETGEGGSTHNTTKKKRRSSAPPLICLECGDATRTRHHTQIEVSTLTGTLLRPVLVECLSYLDEESIRRVCCVSKHYHALIHKHPKLKDKYISILEIRAVYKNDCRRPIPNLVRSLYRHRNKLQHYQKINIIGKIHCDVLSPYKINKFVRQFSLRGVVALDISVPVGSSCSYYECYTLSYALASMLPNLQELDLSNPRFPPGWACLNNFLSCCKRLKRITWNNINPSSHVFLTGPYLGNYASRLQELYMDDSTFLDIGRDLIDGGRMSDLDHKAHAGIFLFYKCTKNSKLLRRVSIKNAKYIGSRSEEKNDLHAIPQTALIKYVRNAPPSLRWFRSDLSDANIRMLQHERPDIEFTN